MENYLPPLSEVMDGLQKKGYTYNFNLLPDQLHCADNGVALSPDEFEIDSFYRFEGMSDPSDTMILYAISSEKHGLKGLLVNAFGVNSDPISAALVDKLSTSKNN